MFDVVTIGAATRDIFIESPFFKIVRDPKHLERLGFPTGEAQCFALGSKIEVGAPFETIGGGAANAAVTFRRQGFRVGTFAKIGRDTSGQATIADLRHEGVTPLVATDSKYRTSFSVILVSPGGERTILDYRGASQHVRTRDVPLTKLRAPWAYISTGHVALSVMQVLIRHLKKTGSRIAMNPSKFYLEMGMKKLRPILGELDVILLNREEAAYLTGLSYHAEKRIFKKFDEVVRGLAVMTDGPRGVLVSDGARIYHAHIFKNKKIQDRTGAGDAFGSGFVAGLIRTKSAKRTTSPSDVQFAIRLGSANATSVVEKVGATPGILHKSSFVRSSRWRYLKVFVKPL